MGTAEDVVGAALARRRAQVTITSKVGLARPAVKPHLMLARAVARPLRRWAPFLTRGVGAALTRSDRVEGRFGVAEVEASLAETLRRLRTDYLDLYLLHAVRPSEVTEELLACLERIRSSGKARAVGLATSYDDTAEIDRTTGAVFDAHQYSWNVLNVGRRSPSHGRFLLTHRALAGAQAPLDDWLGQNPDIRLRLSDAVGEDLADRTRLADLLLAAAMAQNPEGIVLVASRQARRAGRLGALAQDTGLLAAGRRLTEALAAEADRPPSRVSNAAA